MSRYGEHIKANDRKDMYLENVRDSEKQTWRFNVLLTVHYTCSISV
jgi:hypothetical protein